MQDIESKFRNQETGVRSFSSASAEGAPGLPPSAAGSDKSLHSELANLLGPLVHPLLRDATGALDLKKIKAKNFEQFKKFLIDQVKIDGISFNAVLFDSYHKVLAKKEYEPLLRVLWESNIEHRTSNIEDCESLLQQFTSEIVNVSAERFVSGHFHSSTGRQLIRHVLGDSEHFTKSLRSDLAKAIASVGESEGLARDHADEIRKNISNWNYFNVAVSSEEIADASLHARLILDAAEKDEAKSLSDSFLPRSELEQIQARLDRLRRVAADDQHWATHESPLATGKNRSYLIQQAELFIRESKGIRSEADFKSFNARLQEFLKAPLPPENPDSVVEATYKYLRHKVSGYGLENLFEGMPPSGRRTYEELTQLSDELSYAAEMGERLFVPTVPVGTPAGALRAPRDAERLALHSHAERGNEGPLQNAKSQFIQVLEQAKRSLWYGYKQHKAISRAGSNIAEYFGGTGNIVDIRNANREIDGMIKRLQNAQSQEAIEKEISHLNDLLQAEGALYKALEAAEMDGYEQLIGLGQTIAVILSTTLVTKGLGTAAAVANALKAGNALRTSAFAARAVYGMKMGAWISFAENGIAVASGEVRQGQDTIWSLAKDSIATGLAMGLFTPLAAKVGHAVELNVLQRFWARYFTGWKSGFTHFAGDTVLEGFEELFDANFRQFLDLNFHGISFDQAREILMVSGAGGGFKIGAVVEGFRTSDIGRRTSGNGDSDGDIPQSAIRIPQFHSVPPFLPALVSAAGSEEIFSGDTLKRGVWAAVLALSAAAWAFWIWKTRKFREADEFQKFARYFQDLKFPIRLSSQERAGLQIFYPDEKVPEVMTEVEWNKVIQNFMSAYPPMTDYELEHIQLIDIKKYSTFNSVYESLKARSAEPSSLNPLDHEPEGWARTVDLDDEVMDVTEEDFVEDPLTLNEEERKILAEALGRAVPSEIQFKEWREIQDKVAKQIPIDPDPEKRNVLYDNSLLAFYRKVMGHFYSHKKNQISLLPAAAATLGLQNFFSTHDPSRHPMIWDLPWTEILQNGGVLAVATAALAYACRNFPWRNILLSPVTMVTGLGPIPPIVLGKGFPRKPGKGSDDHGPISDRSPRYIQWRLHRLAKFFYEQHPTLRHQEIPPLEDLEGLRDWYLQRLDLGSENNPRRTRTLDGIRSDFEALLDSSGKASQSNFEAAFDRLMKLALYYLESQNLEELPFSDLQLDNLRARIDDMYDPHDSRLPADDFNFDSEKSILWHLPGRVQYTRTAKRRVQRLMAQLAAQPLSASSLEELLSHQVNEELVDQNHFYQARDFVRQIPGATSRVRDVTSLLENFNPNLHDLDSRKLEQALEMLPENTHPSARAVLEIEIPFSQVRFGNRIRDREMEIVGELADHFLKIQEPLNGAVHLVKRGKGKITLRIASLSLMDRLFFVLYGEEAPRFYYVDGSAPRDAMIDIRALGGTAVGVSRDPILLGDANCKVHPFFWTIHDVRHGATLLYILLAARRLAKRNYLLGKSDLTDHEYTESHLNQLADMELPNEGVKEAATFFRISLSYVMPVVRWSYLGTSREKILDGLQKAKRFSEDYLRLLQENLPEDPALLPHHQTFQEILSAHLKKTEEELQAHTHLDQPPAQNLAFLLPAAIVSFFPSDSHVALVAGLSMLMVGGVFTWLGGKIRDVFKKEETAPPQNTSPSISKNSAVTSRSSPPGGYYPTFLAFAEENQMNVDLVMARALEGAEPQEAEAILREAFSGEDSQPFLQTKLIERYQIKAGIPLLLRLFRESQHIYPADRRIELRYLIVSALWQAGEKDKAVEVFRTTTLESTKRVSVLGVPLNENEYLDAVEKMLKLGMPPELIPEIPLHWVHASPLREWRLRLFRVWGKKKQRNAFSTIRKAIHSTAVRDHDLQIAVAEALGDMGATEVVQELTSLITPEENRRKNVPLTLACVRALFKLGEKGRDAALYHLQRTNPGGENFLEVAKIYREAGHLREARKWFIMVTPRDQMRNAKEIYEAIEARIELGEKQSVLPDLHRLIVMLRDQEDPRNWDKKIQLSGPGVWDALILQGKIQPDRHQILLTEYLRNSKLPSKERLKIAKALFEFGEQETILPALRDLLATEVAAEAAELLDKVDRGWDREIHRLLRVGGEGGAYRTPGGQGFQNQGSFLPAVATSLGLQNLLSGPDLSHHPMIWELPWTEILVTGGIAAGLAVLLYGIVRGIRGNTAKQEPLQELGEEETVQRTAEEIKEHYTGEWLQGLLDRPGEASLKDLNLVWKKVQEAFNSPEPPVLLERLLSIIHEISELDVHPNPRVIDQAQDMRLWFEREATSKIIDRLRDAIRQAENRGVDSTHMVLSLDGIQQHHPQSLIREYANHVFQTLIKERARNLQTLMRVAGQWDPKLLLSKIEEAIEQREYFKAGELTVLSIAMAKKQGVDILDRFLQHSHPLVRLYQYIHLKSLSTSPEEFPNFFQYLWDSHEKTALPQDLQSEDPAIVRHAEKILAFLIDNGVEEAIELDRIRRGSGSGSHQSNAAFLPLAAFMPLAQSEAEPREKMMLGLALLIPTLLMAFRKKSPSLHIHSQEATRFEEHFKKAQRGERQSLRELGEAAKRSAQAVQHLKELVLKEISGAMDLLEEASRENIEATYAAIDLAQRWDPRIKPPLALLSLDPFHEALELEEEAVDISPADSQIADFSKYARAKIRQERIKASLAVVYLAYRQNRGAPALLGKVDIPLLGEKVREASEASGKRLFHEPRTSRIPIMLGRDYSSHHALVELALMGQRRVFEVLRQLAGEGNGWATEILIDQAKMSGGEIQREAVKALGEAAEEYPYIVSELLKFSQSDSGTLAELSRGVLKKMRFEKIKEDLETNSHADMVPVHILRELAVAEEIKNSAAAETLRELKVSRLAPGAVKHWRVLVALQILAESGNPAAAEALRNLNVQHYAKGAVSHRQDVSRNSIEIIYGLAHAYKNPRARQALILLAAKIPLAKEYLKKLGEGETTP